MVCRIRDKPARGGHGRAKLYVGGDNKKYGVNSTTITVTNSNYYKPCTAPDKTAITWESRPGEIFDKVETYELEHWEPRQ